MKIHCVQHQWSRRLFWEMQENRGTKRGGIIVWGAVSQSYVGLLHMTHDLWLTEWSRLHGYPIDDSLVSSVHMLGYGVNYFFQDDNAPCCKVAIVKELKAQHDVHTSWTKSPDLKPIDNFWADIKPDLSRNTQGNALEFEITIHDILNQIPTKRSSQCLVGSRTVSILVVAMPAIMLLFVVL